MKEAERGEDAPAGMASGDSGKGGARAAPIEKRSETSCFPDAKEGTRSSCHNTGCDKLVLAR